MLCQLLEFKVNYCLLDSNNVFTDFLLKYLEMIETGSVRKSEILIGNIMKFLFHLSKQKDKKIITIPKIINITDNLLANNNIRSCSVLSLVELAYELFFNENVILDTTELYTKELNTQKEVVFSMLIKFLDYFQIQNITSLVILLNKSTSVENENEFLTSTLQMIKDKRIIIDDVNSFRGLENTFLVFEKSILLENKNFEDILRIFIGIIDEVSYLWLLCKVFKNIKKLKIESYSNHNFLSQKKYFLLCCAVLVYFQITFHSSDATFDII